MTVRKSIIEDAMDKNRNTVLGAIAVVIVLVIIGWFGGWFGGQTPKEVMAPATTTEEPATTAPSTTDQGTTTTAPSTTTQ